MTSPTPKTAESLPKLRNDFNIDAKFVRLAREIAMEIHPLPEILQRMEVSEFEWAAIQQNTRFQQLLASAVEEWNSATNTAERVKIKSLAFVEEALPEFFARAHDPKEGLAAKVEVLKTVSKFAGVGEKTGGVDVGSRFSVTINMGDTKVSFEKQLPAQVTIDQPQAIPLLDTPLHDVSANAELA